MVRHCAPEASLVNHVPESLFWPSLGKCFQSVLRYLALSCRCRRRRELIYAAGDGFVDCCGLPRQWSWGVVECCLRAHENKYALSNSELRGRFLKCFCRWLSYSQDWTGHGMYNKQLCFDLLFEGCLAILRIRVVATCIICQNGREFRS